MCAIEGFLAILWQKTLKISTYMWYFAIYSFIEDFPPNQ